MSVPFPKTMMGSSRSSEVKPDQITGKRPTNSFYLSSRLSQQQRSSSCSRLVDYSKCKASVVVTPADATKRRPIPQQEQQVVRRVASQRSLLVRGDLGGGGGGGVFSNLQRMSSCRSLAAMMGDDVENDGQMAPFRPIKLAASSGGIRGSDPSLKNPGPSPPGGVPTTGSNSCANSSSLTIAAANVSFRIRRRSTLKDDSKEGSARGGGGEEDPSSYENLQNNLRTLLHQTDNEDDSEGEDLSIAAADTPAVDRRQQFSSLKAGSTSGQASAKSLLSSDGNEDNDKRFSWNQNSQLKVDLMGDSSRNSCSTRSSTTSSGDDEDDGGSDDDDGSHCSSNSSSSSSDSGDEESESESQVDIGTTNGISIVQQQLPQQHNQNLRQPRRVKDISDTRGNDHQVSPSRRPDQRGGGGRNQRPGTVRSKSCSNLMTSFASNHSSEFTRSPLAGRSPPRARDLQQVNHNRNDDWVEQKPLTKRRMSLGNSDLLALVATNKKLPEVAGDLSGSDNSHEPKSSSTRRANRRRGGPPSANRRAGNVRSKSCSNLMVSSGNSESMSQSPLAGRNLPRARDLQLNPNRNADWVEQKPLTKRRMSLGNSGDLLSLVQTNKQLPPPQQQTKEEPPMSPKKANRRRGVAGNRRDGNVRSKSCSNLMSGDSAQRSPLAGCNLPRARDLQLNNNNHNADWRQQKPLTKRRMSLGSGDLLSLLKTKVSTTTPSEQGKDITASNTQEKTAPHMTRRNLRADTVRSKSCTNLFAAVESTRAPLAGLGLRRARADTRSPSNRTSLAGAQQHQSTGNESLKDSIAMAKPTKCPPKKPLSLTSGNLMALLETNPAKRAMAVPRASAPKLTSDQPPSSKPHSSISSSDLTSMLDPSNFSLSNSRRTLLAPNRSKSLRVLRPAESKNLNDQATTQKTHGSLSSSDLTSLLDPRKFSLANSRRTLQAANRSNSSRALSCATNGSQKNQTTPKQPEKESPSSNDLKSMLDPGKFSLSNSRRTLLATNRSNSMKALRTANNIKMESAIGDSKPSCRRSNFVGAARSQSCRSLVGNLIAAQQGSGGNPIMANVTTTHQAEQRKSMRILRLAGARTAGGPREMLSSGDDVNSVESAGPTNRRSMLSNSRSQSLRSLHSNDENNTSLARRGGVRRRGSCRNLLLGGTGGDPAGMGRSNNSRRNLMMGDGFGSKTADASSFVTGSRIRRLSIADLKQQSR